MYRELSWALAIPAKNISHYQKMVEEILVGTIGASLDSLSYDDVDKKSNKRRDKYSFRTLCFAVFTVVTN